MRTWGRVEDASGRKRWVLVETDPAGFSDYVYITALVQCLKLNLAESPFWADFGIPAHQAIVQQAAPDHNVQFIASYFSRFFASLIISRAPIEAPASTFRAAPATGTAASTTSVTYYIQVLRFDGSLYQASIGL